MVSKALRMNASSTARGTVQPASPEMRTEARSPLGSPSTPRVFQRRVTSSKNEIWKKPKKFIHVHHYRQTSLYGAWFNDPSKPGKKKRLFFGSHLTAYLAARAQDRAALKYKPYALDPSSIKLNFKEEDYAADEELRNMLTCDEFGILLRKESRPKYTTMEHTPCLRRFMLEEFEKGNIPGDFLDEPVKDKTSLKKYLRQVLSEREEAVKAPWVSASGESNLDQESSDQDFEEPVPTDYTAAPISPKPLRMEHDTVGAKVERKKRTGRSVLSGSKPSATALVRTVAAEPKSVEEGGAGLVRKKHFGRSVLPGSKPSETARIRAVAEPKSVNEEGAGLSWKKRTGRSVLPGSKPSETALILAVAEPKSVSQKGAGLALIWGRHGHRSKRSTVLNPHLVTKFKPAGSPRTKLQYKLHKVDLNSKSREPSPAETEPLPPAVDNSPGSTPDTTKSSELSPVETEGLPAEVESTETREPLAPMETEGLPLGIELPIRNKWQFKVHKKDNVKTTEASPKGFVGVPSELEILASAAVMNLTSDMFGL